MKRNDDYEDDDQKQEYEDDEAYDQDEDYEEDRKHIGVLQIVIAALVIVVIVVGIIVSMKLYQKQHAEQTMITVTKEDSVLKMTVGGEENASQDQTNQETTQEQETAVVTDTQATKQTDVSTDATTEETAESIAQEETEATEEVQEETQGTDTAEQSSECVIIGDQNVNFRKGPSKNDQVIGLLAPGMTVTLLGEEGDWSHISSEGQEGYVIKSVLKAVN